MPEPAPFFREAGSGPVVVCLHSNASSSSQWRALMDRLAPRFRVLAVDSLGSGKSPPWPEDAVGALSDEIALLEPILSRASEPVALVGHSYGAALALVAAVQRPDRVRALALYEPTLFALVDAESPPPNAADGIRHAVDLAASALAAGHRSAAAEHFIDYWMGPGTWRDTPEPRRAPIEAAMVNIRRWAHALLGEPTPLAALAALDIPVLLMLGKDSPASSRGVAQLLARALPRLRAVEFEGLGHMGPITDPEVVNLAIEGFLLDRHPSSSVPGSNSWA
jgi:pimeloyl-ACP methyl ester carboxylesterase